MARNSPFDAKIAHFIATHRDEDVQKLAFSSKKYPDVDMPMAIQQIAGWQQARQKIPSWAAVDGILYPPHLNMEQCSSEVTARYKAGIARRLGGDEMADLTGGMGIDFSFLAPLFRRAVYVEKDEHLCHLAENNFEALNLKGVSVVCSDCRDYLAAMPHVSLIYLDPARRNASGGRAFAIADCQPDVAALAETLLSKADNVMVKLSPMLDWHAVAGQLRQVTEIHIVSVRGECKEIIALMSNAEQSSVKVFCVDDDRVFSFLSSERHPQQIAADIKPGMMLFEPNASVMKSGEWGLICHRFGVEAIAENSHLFVREKMNGGIPDGEATATDFPGRTFEIVRLSSMNRREIKPFLCGVEHANIAVRNFPMSAVELRRRLKIADGGDNYIFATTSEKGNHILIMCKKTG